MSMTSNTMHIKLEGIKEVIDELHQLRIDKIPTAVRNALNDTAFGLKEHLAGLMKSTFKNPNPKTIKNIFIRKATKQDPYAVVHFDQLYKAGLDEYMLPLIMGGRRTVMKPSEERMGRYWVPGKGAKVNQYGNISGGQVTQILSRLGLFGDVAGYDMNQTAASKRKLSAMRKRTGKKSTEYFMITKPTGGLKPGVYKRTATGGSVGRDVAQKLGAGSYQRGRSNGNQFSVVRGRGATPIMVFTKHKPKYKPILPFFKSGNQYIAEHLPANLTKEINFYLSRGFGR